MDPYLQNLKSKEAHTTKLCSTVSTLCMSTAIIPKQ